jgi:repressor of nif and glnA expression
MRGDPESPLRWTCKSTKLLTTELNSQGYEISQTAVRYLLHALEYSLQGNKKLVKEKIIQIAMSSFCISVTK